MQKRITFRGMEHSPVIEEHINTQLHKIEEFLSHERPPVTLNLVLESHQLRAHHKIDIRIKSGSYDVYVHRFGPDMYLLLGEVLDIAYRELLKQKEAWVDRHKKGCVQDCADVLHAQIEKSKKKRGKLSPEEEELAEELQEDVEDELE